MLSVLECRLQDASIPDPTPCITLLVVGHAKCASGTLPRHKMEIPQTSRRRVIVTSASVETARSDRRTRGRLRAPDFPRSGFCTSDRREREACRRNMHCPAMPGLPCPPARVETTSEGPIQPRGERRGRGFIRRRTVRRWVPLPPPRPGAARLQRIAHRDVRRRCGSQRHLPRTRRTCQELGKAARAQQAVYRHGEAPDALRAR